MAKKRKKGISKLKYLIRGLVAAGVGFLIMLPISFLFTVAIAMGPTPLGVVLNVFTLPLIFLYIIIMLIISGWVMTKTVEE